MASENAQFPEFEDQVYARYRKTTIGAVAGIRLNPHDHKQRIPFLLQSSLSKFTWNDKKPEESTLEFDYATDVLELYSAQEEKVFKALNPNLFSQGLVVVHTGAKEQVDTSNAVDDNAVLEIAALKNLPQFKKKIGELTSPTTLRRIDEQVKAKDRPYSFIRAIAERIADVGN